MTGTNLEVVKNEFMAWSPRYGEVLPNQVNAQRFANVCYMAVVNNPYLLQCDKESLLRSAFTAAQLGLEPDPYMGQAYFVPFKGKVQLLVGYKGFLQLARNSGQVSSVAARCVYDGDEFAYEFGLNERLHHVPKGGDKLTHVYAVAKFKDGSHYFDVLSKADIDKVRDAAVAGKKSPDASPWKTHYEEMAKKTAIRRIAKYMPQSVQRAEAIQIAAETGNHAQIIDGIVHAEPLQLAAPEPMEAPADLLDILGAE